MDPAEGFSLSESDMEVSPMARPLTPREATEMILANRLRHGTSPDSAQPLRAGRRPGSPQPQRPAPAAAQRADKKE